MNKHKKKCDQLKNIRKNIADKIGVELHQKECTFQGNCTGTCPKCKQEEDILNKALLKKAGLVAMTAGMALSMTACGTDKPDDSVMGVMPPPEIQKINEESLGTYEPLQGDVEYIEDDKLTEEEIKESTDVLQGGVEIPDEMREQLDDTEETIDDETDGFNLEPEMGVAPYIDEEFNLEPEMGEAPYVEE